LKVLTEKTHAKAFKAIDPHAFACRVETSNDATERHPMSPDHILIVFAIIIPCIALMGVWAAFEGTRLSRGIRSGEF
jgi:hypothetical protein